MIKVLFPACVPGAVEIPIKELKGNASAAGVFIEAENLRGLIQLFQGMRIPHILEALARFHGVTFDLWLRSALKEADAKLTRAVLREEDILSMLSVSRRSEKTLRQAAEIKDRAEPGWDEKIVRNGAKILRVLFGLE